MKPQDLEGYEILCQAPTRISFAGGGTDVSPYPEDHGGEVLNATVSIFMSVRLRLRTDENILIHSNTRELLEYASMADLGFDGKLDFIKACARELYRLATGFELYLYSSLPMGSGLGGSGSMCVAVLGAFNHLLSNDGLDNKELAELAYEVETGKLGNACGRQDQYAAAFGGFNHFGFRGGDRVRVRPFDLSRPQERILNQALMLLQIREWGPDRGPSGQIIDDQTNGVKSAGATLEAMHVTKQYVPQMHEALLEVDVPQIGRLLEELWEIKKRFSPLVTNGIIDTAYKRLRSVGMIGGKVTGAGGGGHMLVCCDIEQRDAVEDAAREMGLRIVPFSFVHEGVLSWQAPVRKII